MTTIEQRLTNAGKELVNYSLGDADAYDRYEGLKASIAADWRAMLAKLRELADSIYMDDYIDFHITFENEAAVRDFEAFVADLTSGSDVV